MSAAAQVVELRPGPRDVGSYVPNRTATPTAEQYAGYEAAFQHFNVELFGGDLPPAMLTLAKNGKTLGYYAPKRWGRRGEDERNVGEIGLNPDHVGGDERDVASTIAHEMVHHWQHIRGKPSRRGYHNAEWAAKMESIGLMPSKTGQPGGERTGQTMTQHVVEHGAFARAFEKLDPGVLLPFISGSPAVKGKPEPKKTDPSKSKFTCPTCGDIARGKPTLMIQCIKCVRTARDRVLDVEAEASQDRRRGCSVSSEPAALAGAAEAER